MSCKLGTKTAGIRNVVLTPQTTTFPAGTIFRLEFTFDTPGTVDEVNMACTMLSTFWSQLEASSSDISLLYLELSTTQIIIEAELLVDKILPISDLSGGSPGTLSVYTITSGGIFTPILIIGGAVLLFYILGMS